MSDPAPINAVDISGYILLGAKRLNIHITLEDTDAAGQTELEPDDRDQNDAEFGDEEDAEFYEDAEFEDSEFDDEDDTEDDTEEDAEFDEEDEEDDAGFDEDTEDDTEDVDRDDRAPAQVSLRDLLRPRPRRPEVRYEESGGQDGGGRPRQAGDDRRSRPRRQTSGRSSEGPDGRSSVPDADARRAGSSPPQAGQPARRRSGEGAARPRR